LLRELAAPLDSVWDLTEVRVFNDLKKGTDLWAEAIRNLRKVGDRVASRYNAAEMEKPFKLGGIVVYRVKVLISKGEGVPA
jgi:hypothetical protein